jgi:hypothetical protein
MVTIIQSVSDCCEANPEMGQNGLQSAFLAATLSRSFGPYAQLVPVETHNFGCYHVYKFHHVFLPIILTHIYPYLPVVPHKAVAEVSKIGNL